MISKVNRSASGETWQTLLVQDTLGDDTGNWSCSAENIVGRVSKDLRLIVNGM